MYLPLVFTLGIAYEYWRRRRLLKKRMMSILAGLEKQATSSEHWNKTIQKRISLFAPRSSCQNYCWWNALCGFSYRLSIPHLVRNQLLPLHAACLPVQMDYIIIPQCASHAQYPSPCFYLKPLPSNKTSYSSPYSSFVGNASFIAPHIISSALMCRFLRCSFKYERTTSPICPAVTSGGTSNVLCKIPSACSARSVWTTPVM